MIERRTAVGNRTAQPVEVETANFGVPRAPAGRCELTRAARGWTRYFVPVRQP